MAIASGEKKRAPSKKSTSERSPSRGISAEFWREVHHLPDLPSDSLRHIAFAGRSNVGKSSLINSLTNKKGLARTSSTPGRTQALNFFLINAAFYFVDLPGYGYAKAPQTLREGWKRLINEYLKTERRLAGMVCILDARHDPSDDDLAMLGWVIEMKIPFVVALTKSDKIGRGALATAMKRLGLALPGEIIPVSSHTGAGRERLWGWINGKIKGN